MQGRGGTKLNQPRASSPLQHSTSINHAQSTVTTNKQATGQVAPVAPRGPMTNHVGVMESATMRLMPDTNVSSQTLEDAYVQFIFFCNPAIPSSTDTTELRRGFRSMPRTDNQTFHPFALLELIKKLEAGEIETWGQLVVDMGVKPPDVASGQSTQKVQQYAVRLKVSFAIFQLH